MKAWILSLFIVISTMQTGCATNSKKVGLGMLAGAVVGAGIGHQFIHHGDRKQYESRNTAITSVVVALITGGVLAWHYRELEETKVEVSGRFARYRLCNPDEMTPDLAKQLALGGEEAPPASQLQAQQIGKFAIALDDQTKWAFPTFRKRHLGPEKAESQVTSERYIWEIIRPGSFVTRSQNPEFFFERSDGP